MLYHEDGWGVLNWGSLRAADKDQEVVDYQGDLPAPLLSWHFLVNQRCVLRGLSIVGSRRLTRVVRTQICKRLWSRMARATLR